MSIKKSTDTAMSMQEQDNAILKAALGYAQLLGWAVFPVHSIINGKCTCNKDYCNSIGKHPATHKGFKDATKNSQKIYEWFGQSRKFNIGIATGKVSGFFVVDVDTEIINGQTGIESLEQLIDKFGDIPNTVEQITGSGGLHLLFKYREGINCRTNLLPGIDIRGDGGYIVASPSIHATGRHYEWELSSRPKENEIATAPKWLIDLVIGEEAKGNKNYPLNSNYWTSIFRGVDKGIRNNTATKLVGHLFRRYVDPILVVEIMYLWNETRVNPPLDVSELNTIINSIALKELRRRQGGDIS
ncbi:bifunctional DNA primase/polymerase [Gracilibacillus dipsosauri]|uniref:bifunctional DNA primase/polymerase n=1 Tax=Gracilibacillus dipsosauri TaxID=178340 RepID=UPI0024090B78